MAKLDSSLTPKKPVGCTIVNNWLVYGNGVDPNRKWDGVELSARLLGIPQPAVAPKLLAKANTTRRQGSGSWDYVFFYETNPAELYSPLSVRLTDIMGRYGAPSPKASISLTSATTTGVAVYDLPPPQDPAITTIIIGRTTAYSATSPTNGIYYFLDRIQNGQNEYIDCKADSELGSALDVDNYQLLPATLFASYKTRLFAAQPTKSLVYVSKIDNFESFVPTEAVMVEGVRVIHVFRDVLLCLQAYGIKELAGLDETSVLSMTLRDYGTRLGSLSPDTAKVLGRMFFFLCHDPFGVYVLSEDNIVPQCISLPIADILKGCDASEATLRQAHAMIRKTPPQYWLWLTRRGAADPNDLCLIFDLRTQGWYCAPGRQAMSAVAVKPSMDTASDIERVFVGTEAGVQTEQQAGENNYFTEYSDTTPGAGQCKVKNNKFSVAHRGAFLRIKSGTGAGQDLRLITSVVDAKTVNITPDWQTLPVKDVSVIEVCAAPFKVITREHFMDDSLAVHYKRFLSQFIDFSKISLKSEIAMASADCYANYILSANSATATTVVTYALDANIVANQFADYVIEVVSGKGVLQRRKIVSNTAGSPGPAISFTVAPAWDIIPDQTSVLVLRKMKAHSAAAITASTIKREMDFKAEKAVLDWEGSIVPPSPQISRYHIQWIPKELQGVQRR